MTPRNARRSNILLDCSGHIKISDFGITRELNTIEVANTFVCTLAFMSPERIAGRDYSYASDIWSLGCVIMELCTGKKLFTANSVKALGEHCQVGGSWRQHSSPPSI